MKRLMRLSVLLASLSVVSATRAAEEVSLIEIDNPVAGWRFDNGQEFPGAKGGIALEDLVEQQRRPALRLDGDFSGGGNYVQIGRDTPAVDVETLTYWLKAPKGCSQMTIRLIDGSGQCHQLNLKTEEHGNWQQVILPVAKYFDKAGTSGSVELVQRYEGWGGAKDGKWHNPMKAIYFLCGPAQFDESKIGAFYFSGMKLVVAPPKVEITKEVRIDDMLKEGELDWGFNDGREFPGAKGGVSIVQIDGENAVRLLGDFSGGGAYVSTENYLNGMDITAVRMKVKTANATGFNARYGDASGQCHQGRGFKLTPDNQWHEVVVETRAVVGGEHWGGANDGKWHGGAQYISLLIGGGNAADKMPELFIKDIVADVKASVAVAGESYTESFDSTKNLPEGWVARAPAGAVSVLNDGAFDGANALRIERAETQLNDDVTVLGAPFAAGAGPWSIAGALRSKLYSPDNSFTVHASIETLDAGGGVIERVAVVEQTGESNWKPFNKQIEFPRGAAQARFAFSFKKTHGSFDADALSATPLEVKSEEKIVERIVIDSAAAGNLFLPEAEVKFNIDVQTSKMLPAEARTAFATITDYWGAEIMDAIPVALKRDGRADRRFRFTAELAIPADRAAALLEIGKYYELHVRMPVPGFAEGCEYSGFARLPEAESRKYPAKDIPFTIRNWDSRIAEYFTLASRIGIRQIGTWGSSGHERIEALGDSWYGGPDGVGEVERNGWKNITEEKVRQNAVDFMTRFKDNPHLSSVQFGNEPNERPELVAGKVRAYQLAYEGIKSVKPDALVVATSVPALETFFAAGYHKWTDIYDFHVYETYENVRQAIRRYRELGKKYGAEKPIWCTELGLNSQGQTRYAVAQEVVKKFTAFFAEGGANVSWFTIMYPDNDGKGRGTGGNAHNIFDAQYSRYNPRLDAIMNYVMINNINIKKFADEVQHADGVQSYLFADPATGDAFHILWKEGPLTARGIKLPALADGKVKLTRIDGSSTELTPASGAVTLGLSSEPVMLRYNLAVLGAIAVDPLPRDHAPAAFAVADGPLSVLKGKSRPLTLTGASLRASDFAAELPPRWTATFTQTGADVICEIAAPAETEARSGRVMIRKLTAGKPSGEIALTLPIMSPISVDTTVLGRNPAGEPGILVTLTNNGAEPKTINWTAELLDAWNNKNGNFALNAPGNLASYLKGDTEGQATLEGGATRPLNIQLADFVPQTIYRARITVTDDTGRRAISERYIGGFATLPRATVPPTIDGNFDDPIWAKSPPEVINTQEATFRFGGTPAPRPWAGPADLSATWRGAWDETYFYLAVEVTDDVFHAPHSDGSVWNQDGLQFLFDPTRTSAEKLGKYDYSLGLGTKGPQAWCHLTAHSSVPEGEATSDIKMAIVNNPLGGAGGKRYELAIPWTRLAPFTPHSGANLGMGLILNEDDGAGRIGFTGWFSGPHSKNLDDVGDLILSE